MPAKKSSNNGSKAVEAREKPAQNVAEFSYVDADGIEQTLDLFQVKNLGDTAYAESQKLFPNATQCYVGKEGIAFDDEGRPNMLNENLVIVDVRWMAKSDYGPWFLLQCAHPEMGEITIPCPGDVSHEAIEAISGIAWKDFPDTREPKGTKAGERFGASELPTWVRFEFVPDAGKYGNGYFVILPARELADATPVE